MKGKFYIEADMEGASGVSFLEEVVPGRSEWERARRWLTADINAAVAGISEVVDAATIVVADAHWGMGNILLDELDDRVDRVVRGIERVHPQLEGLDSTFDAVLAIGNHDQTPIDARPGLLAHTWLPGWRWKINGKEVSETELNAYTAGCYGVPLIMVSGDDKITDSVRKMIAPGVAAAVVKESHGLQTCSCMSFRAARSLIKDAAADAISRLRAGEFSPLQVEMIELAVSPVIPDGASIPDSLADSRDGDYYVFNGPTLDVINRGARLLSTCYRRALLAAEHGIDSLRYSFLVDTADRK